jgi:TolB-like protein
MREVHGLTTMTEVFISYARADEPQAVRIARAVIAAGYDVWWDSHLPIHRGYSKVIEENLAAAKAVLVLWSKGAADSDWVRAEAEVARSESKLVQVALDGVRPPLPFNQIQCADLAGWNGEADGPQWRKVVAALAELTGRSQPDVRPGDAARSLSHDRPGVGGAALELPSKPSIAVLPFLNMSGDREQEYFADAVSEDIITALSRWRWFFVIARNSSFAYKGAAVDVSRVGRELGVRYVLEGSVRKVGERVRVHAQLVEAESATHIWAETFDRDLAHLLDMQDEITEQVVAAIEPAMRQSEGDRLARKPLTDLTALDCFQRGTWRLNKINWHLDGGSRDDYGEALALFRKAVALDPELPLGHIGLARALYGGAIYGWTARAREDLVEARNAARTAIGLDPRDALGYFAASGASLYLGEHAAALDEARRTIVFNANFGFGHFRLGQVHLYGGRPREAIAPIERSLRFSPFDPQLGAMHLALALARHNAGDYDVAVEQARFALYLGNWRAAAVLAAGLVRLGRLDEAAHEIERAPAGDGAPRMMRPPYANPEDGEQLREAVRLARRAAVERVSTVPADRASL